MIRRFVTDSEFLESIEFDPSTANIDVIKKIYKIMYSDEIDTVTNL